MSKVYFDKLNQGSESNSNHEIKICMKHTDITHEPLGYNHTQKREEKLGFSLLFGVKFTPLLDPLLLYQHSRVSLSTCLCLLCGKKMLHDFI